MKKKAPKHYYTQISYDSMETDFKEGIEGLGVIHITGTDFSGSETLCGHTNRNNYETHVTEGKPTCTGCLEIWNYVKNHNL